MLGKLKSPHDVDVMVLFLEDWVYVRLDVLEEGTK